MNFEWDEFKNRTNIAKHGIDFNDVSSVFDGPMIVRIDDRKDYRELRWIGTGYLINNVVVVVYLEIDDDGIRLISARKALKNERKEFEKNSKTDWARLDAMTDEDIDTSDIPPLDEDFFANAELRMPKAKSQISMRVDSDVLAWFKGQGSGYQTRMNAVLRLYMEAQTRGGEHQRSA